MDPVVTVFENDPIGQAARQLEAGELVAFPTETVYGLGADAENVPALAQIFAVKGRPSNHPVIVHLAVGAPLSYWAKDIPAEAYKLIEAFWPGPLTLILQRASYIPSEVSGGQASIGLRCPSHPVAQALLNTFKGGKGGIAAPSANKFGHVSPTMAKHVHDEFVSELAAGLIGSVLDGAQSEVGIESSILDLTRLATHGPVLLRPGHISADAIAAVLGRSVSFGAPLATDANDKTASAPRVSGSLDAHYAPNTPVVQIDTDNLHDLLKRILASGKKVALMQITEELLQLETAPSSDSAFLQRAMPRDAKSYAHDLYASLRELDSAEMDLIVVESLPQNAEWQGVNDRLARASFDSRHLISAWLGSDA
ncbi:MAG: threonylcarbamoyl-AMP synthase [Burkholderiaceae bacterium]|nr:threonylcarbamoyl-AMP synthase [Burkholderiaceae bacterium]